jgi:hypothetical protein
MTAPRRWARLIVVITVVAAAPSGPRPDVRAQTPAPSEPTVTVSVPAACGDVWSHVLHEFDRSWNVTVLAPSKKEQGLPMPDVLDRFLASVPGLERAVAHMDALDRDVFYVRLHTRRLAELTRQYPAIDRALLERAKVEACQRVVADPAPPQAPASGSTPEQRIAVARKLLSEVERSPSAYLPELRAKLRHARSEAQAVLDRDPHHPEGRELAARIDSLLAQLAPRSVPNDPTEAEAQLALERVERLVKGGGRRGEVEAEHTHLRQLISRLKHAKGSQGLATNYDKLAEHLWALYASRLTKLEELCAGCPVLDLAVLATGFDEPRVLGAGDYSLDDLATMPADPTSRKPAYAPLLTGDFNRDGSLDVALIGRGRQNGKDRLFVLVASRALNQYRRQFLKPLDWNKAALAAADGQLILGTFFGPTDHFWWVRWDGRDYVLRYAGAKP